MKVKNELGPDAVILYQRKVKPKGLFGIFKNPIIEVVAAKEDREELITNKSKEKINPNFGAFYSELSNEPKEEIIKPSLSKEVDEIKTMLNTVINKINQQELPSLLNHSHQEEVSKLFYTLKEQGLEEEIVKEILQKCIAYNDFNVKGIEKKEEIRKEIAKVVDKYIMYPPQSLKSKIMFFIGPTGVGKTTTIAKLAAQFLLNEGKSIGLISADTYRIAAVEQLKTYSDILNIPLEVIYHPSEIHNAIKKLNEKDIIMIDTAGRSHKNQKQIIELKALLDEIEEKDIYLVMSCTSKERDIKEIINSYKFIENYSVIFTKLDEATTFGSIINTGKETKRPIAYITTGQSVPDDIEEVSIEKIVSLITKEAMQ